MNVARQGFEYFNNFRLNLSNPVLYSLNFERKLLLKAAKKYIIFLEK